MIKSVTLHMKRGNFTNKLYSYKNKKITFNFTDGVNIITGRNGSGKSVLLNIIKSCCGIGKDSTYPRMPHPFDISHMFNDEWQTMPQHIKSNLQKKEYPDAEIEWDGAMVHHLAPEYFSARNLWDMMDSPFPNERTELFDTGEVLGMMMSNASKGESTNRLLMKVFQLPTEYDEPLTKVNDVWIRASNTFQDWIHSFPQEKGKPTLLIDELDEHLDLDNQKFYWEYINHLTKKWQVIVISHSIFAFRHTELNHIPLNPDYLKAVREL